MKNNSKNMFNSNFFLQGGMVGQAKYGTDRKIWEGDMYHGSSPKRNQVALRYDSNHNLT